MKVISNMELARAIRDICHEKGKKRCAVAFWGENAAKSLFPNGFDSAEIILDISMGGTTRNALDALGVPHSGNIFVCDGLHAKIYIGQSKAIVCSANASLNALGADLNGGRLHEVGVCFDAVTDQPFFADVVAEYHRLKKLSHRVTQADYDRAPRHASGHMRWNGGGILENSLLDRVASRPDDFGNCLFVFGDITVSNEALKKAQLGLAQHMHEEQNATNENVVIPTNRTLVAYCEAGATQNFENAKLVAFYWGTGDGFHLYAYCDLIAIKIGHGRRTDVAYFGRRDWRTFKRLLGQEALGKVDDVSNKDCDQAKNLAGESPHGERWKEYSAAQIADILA